MLRQAAEIAQQAKVMLAIEYLNRFECYFLTTAADARALVKAVDHPHFRTMYDTFHANIEEKDVGQDDREPRRTVSATSTSARTTAARRAPGTSTGTKPSRRCKKVGYDGWMVIEAFGRALPDLAAATKVWRDLFPSPEEVYTKGLKFIKDNLASV